MKDLVTILEMAERLGFNTDSLTFQEGVQIKTEIMELLSSYILGKQSTTDI